MNSENSGQSSFDLRPQTFRDKIRSSVESPVFKLSRCFVWELSECVNSLPSSRPYASLAERSVDWSRGLLLINGPLSSCTLSIFGVSSTHVCCLSCGYVRLRVSVSGDLEGK